MRYTLHNVRLCKGVKRAMNRELLTADKELKTIEKSILNTPALKDLSSEQLEEIAKLVIVQKYTQQMSRDVELLKFDYKSLKESFIKNVSTSENTRLAYLNALRNFEEYIAEKRIDNILDINNSIADDFIFSLRNAGLSASTVRQYTGAISSFFSFVERQTDGIIKNYFRGTKARPKAKTNNVGKFYNICINEKTLNEVETDLNTIIEHIDNKELKAIILIMKTCGLRVGAFNEKFQIKGNKFICSTKGNEFVGTLTDNCLKAIRNAGLKHTNVFSGWTDTKLKNLFKYHTNNLFKKGLIRYAYSCHDLRHFFAITEYKKDCDIYRVSKLLGHSSISITERYLKGLNCIA